MNVFIPHGNYIFLRKKDRPLIEIPLDTNLSWSLLVKKENLFQCILTPMKVMFLLQESAAEIILTSGEKKNIYIYILQIQILKLFRKGTTFPVKHLKTVSMWKMLEQAQSVCQSISISVYLSSSLPAFLSVSLSTY